MTITLRHVFRRGKAYRYRRRVPIDVQNWVDQKEWVFGIGTQMSVAIDRASTLDSQIDDLIKAVRSGQPAAALDLPWQRAKKVAPRPVGPVAAPVFSAALRRDQLLYPTSSFSQQDAALALFIKTCGDPPVDRISREQVMAFVRACEQRGHKPASIRRRLGALAAVVNRYQTDHDLNLRNPCSRVPLRRAGPRASDKEPFEHRQVEALDAYLAASDRLQPSTRAVFWLVRCSTLGPAEAGGLAYDDVCLTASVPHVIIRPNQRRDLKADARRRKFPLVGPALAHAADLPVTGKFKGTHMSNTLNGVLRRAVTDRWVNQSVYSLRHNWKDWLLESGAGPDLTRHLMGHAARSPHERYGRVEPRLSDLLTAVQRAYALSLGHEGHLEN